MTSWLPALLLLQASQAPASIPLRPGLTQTDPEEGEPPTSAKTVVVTVARAAAAKARDT